MMEDDVAQFEVEFSGSFGFISKPEKQVALLFYALQEWCGPDIIFSTTKKLNKKPNDMKLAIFFRRASILLSCLLGLHFFLFPCAVCAQQPLLHRVASGETLYGLSKRYDVTIQQIVEANPGLTPENLKSGTDIQIPRPSAAKLPAPPPAIKEAGPTPCDTVISGDCQTMHKVRRKETVYGIAQKYGISVALLLQANPDIKDDCKLQKGQFLCIPSVRLVPRVAAPRWVGYNEIRIAILLPLTSDGISGDRSLEFYRGFLLSADQLRREGKRITLYAYEEPSSGSSGLADLFSRMQRDSVQFLVGPLYPTHFDEVAMRAANAGIKVLIPFSSKADCVYTHSGIYMINTPDTHKYEFATRLLLDYFGNRIKVVFVDEEHRAEESDFTQYLRTELGRSNVPVGMLPAGYTPSQMAAQALEGHTLLVVHNSSSAATMQSATKSLSAFRRAYPSHPVALLGYPEWQTLASPGREALHSANTYVMTSSFYNPWSQATGSVTGAYKQWFHQDLLDVTPRMALLGYDCCTTLVRGLSIYGNDFADQPLDFPLLQSDISFHSVGDRGGYVNSSFSFIHYRTDQQIEKVSPR